MSETTTPLAVGDWIKDNDPRMPDRVLEVVEMLPNGVRAAVPGRGNTGLTIIRMDRIRTDGKPRRYGWNRIEKP